jgi:hypothetical protein
MVLRSAVARAGLVLLKAHPAAVEAKVVAEVAVDAAAEVEARVVAEAVVDAAEMVVEATAVAMQAMETEAGDVHAVTHFRYSTGPGAA